MIILPRVAQRRPLLRAWHFGLKKDFKALPIRLENPSVIVLEGDDAVIGGFKDREGSFQLTPKLTITK